MVTTQQRKEEPSDAGPSLEGVAADAEVQPRSESSCRFCGSDGLHSFIDLGKSPLCESYFAREQLDEMEPFYPLHAYVCEQCFLVQLHEYVSGEDIFSHYAYFSSYSDSWVQHAQRYVEEMIDRFGLGPDRQVVEVASNDGYLLQHFVSHGVPVLGIEPAANVAEAAKAKNVSTLVKFFGTQTARDLVAEGRHADLLIGNNVLAHVPDLNDFVAGLKLLLASDGVLTMEFPHLLRLMEENQFDTIYHEHFCYFSLMTAVRVFAAHGLCVFDVQQLPTHGGSLRVFVRHEQDASHGVSDAVEQLVAQERKAGLHQLKAYSKFADRVHRTKQDFLQFLIQVKRDNKQVVGYGAPGKGNTLLNYCGIRTDFLAYTVDRNPFKQGKFLPGTHIPIHAPEKIAETRPDYVVLLPWNLKEELVQQLDYVRDWGGRLVVPIPQLEVLG